MQKQFGSFIWYVDCHNDGTLTRLVLGDHIRECTNSWYCICTGIWLWGILGVYAYSVKVCWPNSHNYGLQIIQYPLAGALHCTLVPGCYDSAIIKVKIPLIQSICHACACTIIIVLVSNVYSLVVPLSHNLQGYNVQNRCPYIAWWQRYKSSDSMKLIMFCSCNSATFNLILIQKYITMDAEPLIKPTIKCSCNNIVIIAYAP